MCLSRQSLQHHASSVSSGIVELLGIRWSKACQSSMLQDASATNEQTFPIIIIIVIIVITVIISISYYYPVPMLGSGIRRDAEL